MAKTAVKTKQKASKTTVKRTKTAAKRPKTAVKKTKKTALTENLFSISALSRKFKLDRATIRERLDRAEIKPVSVKSREKLYLLEDVELTLSQSELNEAKLQKMEAEAKLKQHDLKVKNGEFASVSEFTEITQKIFSALHKKLAVQFANRWANRIHKAKSVPDVKKIIKREIDKEFNALRSDFKKYL